MFKRAIAKLSIGSLDDSSLSVDAHYNPKELQYQRSVPWAAHPLADHGASDQLDIEFTGAQPRTMELEMLFDCYEANPDDSRTIEQLVTLVDTLAAVRDPNGDAAHLRPHFCIVTWGDRGVKPLRCVIESIAVKYTMLDRIGTPLRAVCNLKVREARLRDSDFEASSETQMRAMRQRMADRTEASK